ncbi:cytochrome P450 alkane hydroxylase [Calycina marina]|uniref:Cytochrome P450 alkane hydroxylase n=1 Tax=Calycina marina TaxID=1763456 RepID=A0A9P7YZV5_9HELO|nr:cytochrome P450 alkane hydroxylase [Calycina marina]
MLGLFALALVGYCLTYCYRRLRRQRRHWRLSLENCQESKCIPARNLGNRPFFGVDELWRMYQAYDESRLMEYYNSDFKKSGYTIEQRCMGTSVIRTAEPANVEAILSSRFADWSIKPRRQMTFNYLGEGIFNQDGIAWRQTREILKPLFNQRIYLDLKLFDQHIANFFKLIPPGGGIIDLQPLFYMLTLDVSTEFLFGTSVSSLTSTAFDGSETFGSVFGFGRAFLQSKSPVKQLLRIIEGTKFQDACKRLHHCIDKLIHNELAVKLTFQKPERSNLMQRLTDSFDDHDTIRGQVLNILLAGRDTTASLLSWIFFLLARHSRVLNKLRQEINSTCQQNPKLSHGVLRQMKYLQLVIKETLRLYPAVAANVRTSVSDTILPTGGGSDGSHPVWVPKDTTVMFNVYAMHRRTDLYGDDAEDFRPERWDEPRLMQADLMLRKWGYLPFNGGPRICIGRDFAETEVAYTIVRILQKFSSIQVPEGVEVVKTGQEKQSLTLVMFSADGCKMELGEKVL